MLGDDGNARRVRVAHQDLRVNHGEGDGGVEASVVDHVLDGDRAARDLLLSLEDFLLLGLQLHGGGLCRHQEVRKRQW